MGLIFCLVALVSSYLGGRRSIPVGIGITLFWGYVYGILRANFVDTFSHFVFDVAVVGFYSARLFKPPSFAHSPALLQQRRWFMLLFIWPCIMFVIPLQHVLVQLVGWRGNGFLLPFFLIGMWLQADDGVEIAQWVAWLNLIALAFGLAEYVLGVPRFYPENAVTKLIYNSHDVAGNTALRIPACFANAHAYGGTMVYSLPWLVGGWMQSKISTGQRILFAAGILAALFGVFLCAARSTALALFVLILIATFSGQLRGGFWLAWVLMLGGIGYVVSNAERLQRFATLSDTDFVVSRIEESVNMSFFELVVTYPIGNGLGAGGTSIPFFLQHLLRDRVGLENEYSRILLEQGLIGLALWIGFIGWFAFQRPKNPRDPWRLGKLLFWGMSAFSFAGGMIGVGLMTAIPQTPMFFLGVGFCLTPHFVRRPAVVRTRTKAAAISLGSATKGSLKV